MNWNFPTLMKRERENYIKNKGFQKFLIKNIHLKDGE